MPLRTPRRALIRNTGALYGAQAISMLAPLLTVPYLARTLGPEGWAPVVAAQALGNWLIVLLEYGFDLSGTRAVAKARTTPDLLGDVVSSVEGAKLLLVPAAAAIVIGVFYSMPALRGRVQLLEWTLAFAVCRGLNPFWFFQGMEEVQGAVIIEALTKGAAAVAVLFVVVRPSDGWRVLALQAIFAALSLGILTWWMTRRVRLHVVPMRTMLATLHRTSRIFGMRAAGGVYNQASVLILTALASATSVSYFGGAERIVRSGVSLLLLPLTQAFLPRLSYLSVGDPVAARQLMERCLVALGILGAMGGLVAFVAAPLLTTVLLGPGYAPAAAVMRALSPLPAVVAINTVLAFYWAVPFGHDRRLLVAVLGGGAVNIVLALILVPRLGAVGMALSVVSAECAVTLSLADAYLRLRSPAVLRTAAAP
jgi:PST family polysaccharide transporter